MTIQQELKKFIGKGIDIEFSSAGLIFGNGVTGIICRVVKPNFVELDFCSPGGKKQMININKIEIYHILDARETQRLKDDYKTERE